MDKKNFFRKKNTFFITAIAVLLVLFSVVGVVSAKYYFSKTDNLTVEIIGKKVPKMNGWQIYNLLYSGEFSASDVTAVEFRDSGVPQAYTKSWAIDENKNGDVTAYLSGTTLYIVGNGTGSIKGVVYPPMFAGYSYLTTITNMQLVDCSETYSCNGLFSRCSSLTVLDLSFLDTSNITMMQGMFYHCKNLKTIYVSELFKTDKVSGNTSTMFYYCTSLVGGNGTQYTYSHSDLEYARIDGGPTSSTPGYFTYKAAPTSANAANDEVYEEENPQEDADDALPVPDTNLTDPDNSTDGASNEDPDSLEIPELPEFPENPEQ